MQHENRVIRLQVLLTKGEHQMVSTLSARLRISKAQVARSCIAAQFQMHLNNVPYCVTGRPCIIPNAHYNQNTPLPQAAQNAYDVVELKAPIECQDQSLNTAAR